jgi:hypothetical protein
MSGTYAPAAAARARGWRARADGARLSAWLLAFAPVLYLGLEGGGYDPVVRGEVGIVVWWIVLLGAVLGLLPVRGLRRTAWAGLALMAAFTVWTALSLTWTESDERTMAELGRLAAYLAVFALALFALGRTAVRHALDGLAAAIVVVAGVAVLSRLQPQLAPDDDLVAFFGEAARNKLAYPLNYWNALAAFAAIGLPLVLRAATSARTIAMQAVAAGAVPVLALTVFLTASRGGAVALAAAALAWIVLSPDRLPKLATAIAAGAGGAILVRGADQRDALQSGLAGPLAEQQGDELLGMAIVVCLGVALLQVAVGLAARYAERPAWLRVPPGRARIGAAFAVALAVGVALAAGLPGTVDREWQEFKGATPAATSDGGEDAFARLDSTYGNGRYDYWAKAADAQETRPLAGIGPGTFEFWWARHRPPDYAGPFVRDAHSWYLETLAELGVVGLALVLALIALTLAAGVARSLGRMADEHRGVAAAATAGCVAFAVAALVEWVWDLPAVAVAFLVLVAAVLAVGSRAGGAPRPARVPVRAAVAVLAVLGMVAVAVPLAGADAVRDSQAAVREGDLVAGLESARSAARVQPYSASAHLQEALIFERAGDLARADALAREASRLEPTNWRVWLTRSRISARRGDAGAAVAAYGKAKRLNPHSELFRTP